MRVRDRGCCAGGWMRFVWDEQPNDEHRELVGQLDRPQCQQLRAVGKLLVDCLLELGGP